MKLSQEQIEEERAKFEIWYMEAHGLFCNYPCFERNDNGLYTYPDPRRCFTAWLACRESIEIAFIEAQGFTVRTK